MRSFDVIIVGGGILGSAVAYALTDAGMRSVAVIDAESMLNVHSTGRNASYYLPMYDTREFAALANASYPFLAEPPDGFADTELVKKTGAVIAATEQGAAALQNEAELARALGVSVAELPLQEAVRLVPILKPDAFATALYYSDASEIDVHALSMSYVRSAKRGGVAFLLDHKLIAVETQGGCVRGVTTSQGALACGAVVNVAGAWCGQVASLAGGLPIAFEPRRRHIIAVKLDPVLVPARWPFFRCPSVPLYFKPDGNGRLLASPMDEDVDEPGDCQTCELQVAAAADAINAFTTLPVRSVQASWAGHRTFSSDSIPVIGADPTVSGLYWAAGLGGAGVMSSRAVGLMVAGAVMGHKCTTRNETYSPGRFARA